MRTNNLICKSLVVGLYRKKQDSSWLSLKSLNIIFETAFLKVLPTTILTEVNADLLFFGRKFRQLHQVFSVRSAL